MRENKITNLRAIERWEGEGEREKMRVRERD